MPDFDLQVTVSRALLALPTLDINDHETYYVAAQFLGAGVTWNRQQATSPFIDGAVTTYRTRQMVNEQVGVEVKAATSGQLRDRTFALIDAFCQDSFILHITLNDADYQYQCEASDYQVAWTGPRAAARQAQVLFTVPRQPRELLVGA